MEHCEEFVLKIFYDLFAWIFMGENDKGKPNMWRGQGLLLDKKKVVVIEFCVLMTERLYDMLDNKR